MVFLERNDVYKSQDHVIKKERKENRGGREKVLLRGVRKKGRKSFIVRVWGRAGNKSTSGFEFC